MFTLLGFLLVLSPAMATLYKEELYIEDLMDYFDSNGCIEGTLAMQPTIPVVLQPHQHSINKHDNHEAEGDHAEESSPSSTVNAEIHNGSHKEKTPMCLVNELARYNRIEHQYHLTSEEGPPHKKEFTVTLKLGTEQYTADGPSIKKAQHSAASLALKSTSFKHPPPKSSRNPRQGNITPTVELNALAMKRGEPTVYTLVEPPQVVQYPHPFHYYQRGLYTQPVGDYNYRGKAGAYRNHRFDQQRFLAGKGVLFKVSVKVGDREFTGEGITAQAARHDAASKALQVLRSLPLDAAAQSCDGASDGDSSSELKSPISLVHEIALKRNLSVQFEVVSEDGPPHMKTFITRCSVGDKFESTGEGNGKKVSKKRAAEKMLEQLKSLPPMSSVTNTCNLSRLKRKPNQTKKKSRNLIKDTTTTNNQQQPAENNKYEPESPEEINPISRLIQIQQAKKEKEPVYTLREERGLPRRREFVMEVSVGEHSFVGTGPNKKIAKRNAAEGLLQAMGYSSSTLDRSGNAIESPQKKDSTPKSTKNGKESKNGNSGGVSGRQLVPGLILMNDGTKPTNGNGKQSGVSAKTTATIAKEFLDSNTESSETVSGHSKAVRPTEQLLYLAQLLNFQVQFADFPKGNHSSFLSLVTLTTEPPHVCHGAGLSIQESQDKAALNALRSLSELGIDSISTPQNKKEASPPPSEGIYDMMSLANAIPTTKEDNYVNGK